jgi:hypothetical protein
MLTNTNVVKPRRHIDVILKLEERNLALGLYGKISRRGENMISF